MIYLDNATTTKTDERVVKAMEKYYTKEYGIALSSGKFSPLLLSTPLSLKTWIPIKLLYLKDMSLNVADGTAN